MEFLRGKFKQNDSNGGWILTDFSSSEKKCGPRNDPTLVVSLPFIGPKFNKIKRVLMKY
jgi:hypothetical protein